MATITMVLSTLLLQILDPTPFAAFGVVGSLMFALAMTIVLCWRLFNKTAEMAKSNQDHNQAQAQTIMDFVDRQRKETHQTMQGVAETVSKSHDDLAASLSTSLGELKRVIDRHSQRLNEAFITSSAFNQLNQGRRRGEPLDETLITKIEQKVRDVLNEQQRREG